MKIQTINLDENPIQERDLISDKLGILDVKATIDSNIVTNIEMQVVRQNNIANRMMVYWSKNYLKELKRGKKYRTLKKTIAILIANFELKNLKEIPKYHTEWKIREKDFSKVILTDILEIHILELPKLKKLIKTENEYRNKKLELWMKFLLAPDELEVGEMKDNPDIKEAKDELETIRKDKYEQTLAELREKYILDADNYKETGYSEGHEAGKLEVAKNLLAEGIDIDLIVKVTGLTLKEIEKLK